MHESVKGQRYFISLMAGLGWLFDSYVTSIWPLVLAALALTWHTTVAGLAYTATLFLVGYTLGTIGFGLLADYLGRKGTLSISILGYGVATALSGLAWSPLVFGITRFLTGLGGGGELPVGATYVIESWPAKHRGYGFSLMYAFYPVGYLLAIAAAAVLKPIFGWRAVFFFAIIPALLIMWGRQKLQESPRFVAEQQRLQDRKQRPVTVVEVWNNPQSRRRSWLGFLLYIPMTYSYYGIWIFVPALLEKTWRMTYSEMLFWMSMFMVSYLVLSFIGGVLQDYIGRRVAGIAFILLGVLAGYIMFNTHNFTIFIVAGIIGWPAGVGMPWVVGVPYLNELFPTRYRATGYGMGVGVGRIVSIFAPLITGALSSTLGFSWAFNIAMMGWVLAIIAYVLGPETMGRELEDISPEVHAVTEEPVNVPL